MTSAPVEWAAVAPPTEMQSSKRWLHWALEPRQRADGTTVLAKVPYYLNGQRRYGDINSDHASLGTYAEAVAGLALWGATRAGLGFALGDGWQGVDFDHCDTRPELAALVSTLPGYVEVSPSRTGIHALGYGPRFDSLGSNASGVEAYAEGRFFTFTGWALRPGPIVDLGPYVSSILAPRHAAHRRVGVIQPRPAIEATGDETLDELADALRYVDPDDRDTWVGVGQALFSLGEVGYTLWASWSATSSRFPGGDNLERWETFKGERTGYAAIFNRAAASGWKNPRKLDPAAIFAGSSLYSGPMENKPVEAPATEVSTSAVVIPPAPTTAPIVAERIDGQRFRETDGRQRASTIENVLDAIAPESGVRVVYDTFQDAVLIGTREGAYRLFEQVDYAIFRADLGRGGFKPVSVEIMRSAVQLTARRNSYDSAKAWVTSVTSEWDGVPRIDVAMTRYFGAEDTPYTRAVGAYLFTALAGRALVPGCQADMAVILVGLQGAGKTSAVRALAPFPKAFGEVDLSKRDADLARQLRGKMVVEWAEMRGLAGRDRDGITAWITRRTEEWVPKYEEYGTAYNRRSIVIGTANTDELLDDPTGERRWLPIKAGQTDVAALEADRAQLWAEGAVRFNANGVEWRVAEELAKPEHVHYKVGDPWAEIIAEWLESLPVPKPGEIPNAIVNGAKPVALHDVAMQALSIRKSEISRVEENRISKILRSFGYEKKNVRIGKSIYKRWLPPVAHSSPS